MKKITFSKNFFEKKKAKAMKQYGLSEEEYQYVYGLGVQKDNSGCALEQFEVVIPDEITNPRTPTPCNTSSKHAPQSGGTPNMAYQQMWSNQQMAQSYMQTAEDYLEKAQHAGSEEEYIWYMEQAVENQKIAQNYQSMPVKHTTMNIAPNGVSSSTTSMNSTFSDICMGLGAIRDFLAATKDAVDTFSSIKSLWDRK